MQKRIRQFANDDSGATAIEYGLIVSLLALAIVGSFGMFAGSLEFMFSDTSSQLVQALREPSD
ncbi:Flp family type IVb pilin [Pseudaminobacter sp. NGMCC 1.201702]|uniref:Flp family type IVb pilin n=1 Tax=Pseudaminobacter sp. NGMCC 1.201702 TaxID=3391825 RepID=UPI0039EF6F97